MVYMLPTQSSCLMALQFWCICSVDSVSVSLSNFLPCLKTELVPWYSSTLCLAGLSADLLVLCFVFTTDCAKSRVTNSFMTDKTGAKTTPVN